MKFIVLFSAFLLVTATDVIAQDDYSEYSHLWEDPKAEKKRKKKEEKLRKKQLKKGLISPDSINAVQTDTIPDTPQDSIRDQQTEPQVPADSLEQQVEEPENVLMEEVISADSIPDPVEEVAEPQPEEETVPEEVEEDIKPEREPMEPLEPDFRAGMAAGGGSSFNGGFTFTQIGGENYVGLTLQPEFKFWKIGLGLNIPVLYGLESQKVRTEIFEGGVGPARVLTYIRYGTQKVDPVYVKVGQLNGTMIGFGGLVNNYTNSTSFEKRKLGIHYDINYKGMGGIEGMYSDFDPASTNLLVTRPYVRPVSFLNVPIVRTLELGATFVTDKDQTSISTSDTTSTSYAYTANGVGAFGLDAGINLLNIPFIQIDAFVNWAKLKLAKGGLEDSVASLATQAGGDLLADGYEDGKGFSYGINFRFNFVAGVAMTDIRIERLSYSEHYVPQFFDTNYELNKDNKILSTISAPSQSGIYGSLTGHILEQARLGGSLMIPDDLGDTINGGGSTALIRVFADVERLADKFSLHASYFKGGLGDLGDAFKFDERSVAKARFIYHLNRFLAVGTDYYYYWEIQSNGKFKATQYVSPYFGLAIQF